MKTNLTNCLSALCAILLIVLLVLQMKLKTEQQAFVSATEQRESEMASAISKLAEQTTNTTTVVQQQTAVLDRALGKVIPVVLPDWFANKFTDLEAQIQQTTSMPGDAEIANMYCTLSNLFKRMPAWAEDDYLPQLNNLRWAIKSLQVLQTNENAANEDLETAAEAYADQLSKQPNDAPTNIMAMLIRREQDATNQYANYRRSSAIIDATNQLALAVMTDGLGTWQRLAEWTNDPTVGSSALERRQQLHVRLLEDEIASYSDITKVELGKLDAVTNNALRQAGYLRTLENVTVQRLRLLQEADAPPSTVNTLADLSATIETKIKAESDSQNIGYQQWALSRIILFNARYDVDVKEPHGNGYKDVKDDMIKWLLPISPAYLDTAVGIIYRQAFDDGMNKLNGPDEKHFQTEVAEKDAITPKKTPQNYLEN